MNALLALARWIDALNERVGLATAWLSLLAVVISTGNALSRHLLDLSSNAWLEIQWYLFSAVFLLCAGYTLRHNGHVRIDILYGRYSERTQTWIDIFGTLVFLFPMAWLVIYYGWGFFLQSWAQNETSVNPGGLLRYPVKLLIPVGFSLLLLQGVAQLIKQVGFLQGRCPNPTERVENLR